MKMHSGKEHSGGRNGSSGDRKSCDESGRIRPWDDDSVLEITWDDLDEVDAQGKAPATASGKHYPAVEDALLETSRMSGEIRTLTMCSHTGKVFFVFWLQDSPGVYTVSRIEVGGVDDGQGTGNMTQIGGAFLLSEFPGCPHCGSMRLSVCEMCHTTICEGAARSSWLGKRTIRCPNCGSRGQLYGQASSALGDAGGKGKKSK